MSRRTTILIALGLVWVVFGMSLVILHWKGALDQWLPWTTVVVVGLMMIQLLIVAFLGDKKGRAKSE